MAKYYTRADFQPGSVQEALHDWYSGITVGASHSVWLAKDFASSTLIRPIQRMLGLYHPEKDARVQQRLAKLKEGEEPTLKVIGIGFGRTGTVSGIAELIRLDRARRRNSRFFPCLH